MRRTGDTTIIDGSYQYNALNSGNSIQRFWHFSKQLTINAHLPPKPTDIILDVGCGSGVISSFLKRSGADVTGIDGNMSAIQFARSMFPEITFIHGLVDSSFNIDNKIDKIYCLEVIEHIYRSQATHMLGTFRNILKPDGKVFISTPNYRSLWPMIEFIMDYLQLAPPLKEHQHVEHYNLSKLRQLCLESGFDIENIATTCCVAPWIAPISWKIALRAQLLDQHLPFGSILNIVLAKSR